MKTNIAPKNKLFKALNISFCLLFIVVCVFFGACSSNKEKTTESQVISNSATFIHLSLDDVEICLNNLKQNKYSSVWDEPLLAFLKKLHKNYNAKFSLYTYNSTLSEINSSYSKELKTSNSWLKFGLHANDSKSNFENSTYDEAKNSWNTFCSSIVTLTGTYLSIDRIPRLHYFAGNEQALKGMKDALYGALGFLSADDNRNSYYFTSEQSAYLYDNDYIKKDDLVFISTDMRGDWFKNNYSQSGTYKKPIKSSVYSELEYRYSDFSFSDSVNSFIFFAHEWQFYNGTTVSNEGEKWFTDICKFANDNGINIDYAQNRLYSYV